MPCSLWTVSAEINLPPVYLGLMPDPSEERAEEPEGVALIEREFGPFLQWTQQSRKDFGEIAVALAREVRSDGEAEHQRVSQLAHRLASLSRTG